MERCGDHVGDAGEDFARQTKSAMPIEPIQLIARSLPRCGTQINTILATRGFASKISALLTTLSGGSAA